jgi:hypothetical protein
LNDSDNITRIYVAFVEGAVTVITDIVLIDYNNTEGLRGPECKEAYYWFSLDSQNQKGLWQQRVGQPEETGPSHTGSRMLDKQVSRLRPCGKEVHLTVLTNSGQVAANHRLRVWGLVAVHLHEPSNSEQISY